MLTQLIPIFLPEEACHSAVCKSNHARALFQRAPQTMGPLCCLGRQSLLYLPVCSQLPQQRFPEPSLGSWPRVTRRGRQCFFSLRTCSPPTILEWECPHMELIRGKSLYGQALTLNTPLWRMLRLLTTSWERDVDHRIPQHCALCCNLYLSLQSLQRSKSAYLQFCYWLLN